MVKGLLLARFCQPVALCALLSAKSKFYNGGARSFYKFLKFNGNPAFPHEKGWNLNRLLFSNTHLLSNGTSTRHINSDMEDADFGDLSVQRVTEADFDDIIKFLRTDFLHNEPLNRSINLAVEDTKGLFDDLVHSGIASSLSYSLRARDGQIAALRLVAILDRPETNYPSKDDGAPPWNNNAPSDNNNTIAVATTQLTHKAQMIANIIGELENKIWILVNPRLKRLLSWTIISVDKNFTRRGLAGKLLSYNLDEAKLMGCQGCVAEASAFKSQQLFKKLGYEAIHEIKHEEWLDENGMQIFKCDDSTKSIQLVFKPL